MYIHNRDSDWEINGQSFTSDEITALGIKIPETNLTINTDGTSIKFNEHGHEVGELKSTDIKTIKTFANKVLVADTKDKEQKEATRKANMTYIDKRRDGYASIQDQLDMQYNDMLNSTTTWFDHIAKVKQDNPKT